MEQTSIEVKTSENVLSYNCLEIFKDNRHIDVELNWPLNTIELKLYNSEISIVVSLLYNQYNYLSEI